MLSLLSPLSYTHPTASAQGITFNLIIVRVDQGVAVGTTCVASAPAIPLQFRTAAARRTADSEAETETGRGAVVGERSVGGGEGEVGEMAKDDASLLRSARKDGWGV